MTTARKAWFRCDAEIPTGPVLYAMERAEFAKRETPVWKLGSTIDLSRRAREFADPYTPRFAMSVDLAGLRSAERRLHEDCPFPRCGGGRELYSCMEDDLWAWLSEWGVGDAE